MDDREPMTEHVEYVVSEPMTEPDPIPFAIHRAAPELPWDLTNFDRVSYHENPFGLFTWGTWQGEFELQQQIQDAKVLFG